LPEKPIDVIVLNLDFKKIGDELLAKIVENAEKVIRKTIEERVGLSFIGDLSIIVTADKGEDKVAFTISIEFTAPKILEIDYESILEEASKRAFEAIEEWLKRNARVQVRGNNKNAG